MKTTSGLIYSMYNNSDYIDAIYIVILNGPGEIFEKVGCQTFQNNIFENKEGVYVASCCCYSVILKLTFQNFRKYSCSKITT